MSVTFEEPSIRPDQAPYQEAYIPNAEPNVGALISEAITLTHASNTDPLRFAAHAESRSEMNT